MATSREPLRITGEATLLVLGLSLPDQEDAPLVEELAGYEAIRLFVERAKAVDTGFALTERNAAAVGRLCQKLDGVPLAIELAAARVRVLSAEQISEQLENSLGLLTTGSRVAALRHQTLRATLEWSHELLIEAERTFFGRLSVFAGGWDLEAAKTVGAGGSIEEGEVLDLLSRLVDKSLVVAEAGEEGALEEPTTSGEEEGTRSPAPLSGSRPAQPFFSFPEFLKAGFPGCPPAFPVARHFTSGRSGLRNSAHVSFGAFAVALAGGVVETQVFQNTQLMGLRFHALVTEGGDQGVQLHSF